MKLYITFGTDHHHEINGTHFNYNTIAEIECDEYEHGREIAFELFGNKFAFDYSYEQVLESKYMSIDSIKKVC